MQLHILSPLDVTQQRKVTEGRELRSFWIISKVDTAPGLSETACDQLQNRSVGVYL